MGSEFCACSPANSDEWILPLRISRWQRRVHRTSVMSGSVLTENRERETLLTRVDWDFRAENVWIRSLPDCEN